MGWFIARFFGYFEDAMLANFVCKINIHIDNIASNEYCYSGGNVTIMIKVQNNDNSWIENQTKLSKYVWYMPFTEAACLQHSLWVFQWPQTHGSRNVYCKYTVYVCVFR